MKKVLLIVVDALASRVLAPALETGRLPHLQALRQSGCLALDCTAIFPSITQAATASIITGAYPRQHGIPGAYWYDTVRDQVVYYGCDTWVILKEGIGRFFHDFLVKLNHQWLRSETLFQRVERAGLRAASLNSLLYRGDVRHQVTVPLLLRLLPGVPARQEVCGPSILCLGDLVAPGFQVDGGPFDRYGFEDRQTASCLIQLARGHGLPDFTVAYFPDNDIRSHDDGPEAAIAVLERLDTHLGEFFEVYGGADAVLDQMAIVLTGDHSQSRIHEDRGAAIHLEELLTGFSLVAPGEAWEKPDEIMACPNLRVAQIYLRHPTHEQVERAANQLLDDPRVDQVLWRGKLVEKGGVGYRVATRDRGRLHFWPGAAGPQTAVDPYGTRWSWSGDLTTVEASVSEGGNLSYSEYPNAFERIAGGLDCENSGDLWVTARPGFEFSAPGMSIHRGGGSHGSLRAADSTVPLLLAGAPPGIRLPSHPRSVDVAPLCLSILELPPGDTDPAS